MSKLGLIQMCAIDLKLVGIERSRRPEHCVKRRDPDVNISGSRDL